jgi:hypothetical protein
MNKTVAFKMPIKAKTADDWIGKGVEPHLKPAATGAAAIIAPVAMKRFTIDVPVELAAVAGVPAAGRGLPAPILWRLGLCLPPAMPNRLAHRIESL